MKNKKENVLYLISQLYLVIGKNWKKETTASLDRIDSLLGYTIDNVQWVHKDINRIKFDMSQCRFVELCCLIAEKHHANKIC